ncbi:hypothetical protein SmJEL517_g04877 [Synchytrium microbalum]|uniref:dolichyl-phosphate beta-glucosyltransferase n=1 Tax=Synchytrium microbalum TaxID=1806994 RepID=A0A507BS53_9FUNG|nr:uncharacterized protein SmJEL517_g04877 [Synchytrium microbalum]TPX31917.1 hypothetical protein SmJEL517_g04877 [Synchytrium microbalum]
MALVTAQALLTFACTIIFSVYIFTPIPRPPVPEESTYTHPISNTKQLHPSLFDDSNGDIHVSLVVPAYNEKDRIGIMLDEALTYFKGRVKKDREFKYEIVVVDDGSNDDTTAVCNEWAKTNKCGELRVLTFVKNRGKGGAVTQGMLTARGEWILFADADGAAKFADLDKLEAATEAILKDGLGVGVGSRAHMVNAEAVVKRSAIRNFLMYSFHTVLFILGISSIKDTQCGFKLFSRNAAQIVIPNMHVEGFIFDIEMLLLAEWNGIPMVEVPISWHEVAGTKMNLVWDSARMARDLLLIRANYLFGLWSVGRFVHEKSKGESKQAGSADRKKK